VVSTTRRWSEADGDPAHPGEILGARVERRLAARDDAPGALVLLSDRRYAITGPVVAVGTRADLRRFIRRREATAPPREAAWLRRALRVLAASSGDRVASTTKDRGMEERGGT
jgi:hypothetical protein